MKFDEDYDARGLICPMPVLKARKRLLSMTEGQILRLRADDPAAYIDVPHFCQETGHNFLSAEENGDHMCYFIQAVDQ